MAELNEEVMRVLTETNNELLAVEQDYADKMRAAAAPFKAEIEATLAKRQVHCNAIDGFWGKAMAKPGSPLKEHFSSSVDSKIVRAITSLTFTIAPEDKEKGAAKKLTIVMRANIFCEAGTLHRAIDGDGAVESVGKIAWKCPEASRKGSLFYALFDAAGDDEKAGMLMGQFQSLYQDPALFSE
jgi:hypothetical protein